MKLSLFGFVGSLLFLVLVLAASEWDTYHHRHNKFQSFRKHVRHEYGNTNSLISNQ
jgi:CHASE3 domain sensor protein